MNSLSSVSKALIWIAGCAGLAAVAAVWAQMTGEPVAAATAAAGAALCLPALYWLRRGAVSIDKAVSVLNAAADGKLRARVLGVRGAGDIGRMLHALNRLLDQTEAFAKEADAAMRAAAEKRYHRKIVGRGLRGDFQRYVTSVNRTLGRMEEQVGRLAQLETKMLRDAVAVSMTVNEGAVANARIVGGVRGAMEQAQAMAAATEQMVAGIHEISSASADAAALAADAETLSGDSRRVAEAAMSEFAAIESAVGDAAARVDGLARASEAIGDILSSIESIAGQTNLLALNATIEAARAGEAGKGFAVVATEVKNLAGQTAKATEDIGRRIDNLRDEMAGIVDTMKRGAAAVAKGRDAMQSMSGRIGDVGDKVAHATLHMGEVTRVLSQQAAAANQISGGVQHVAAQAQENAGAIDESSRALMSVGAEMASLLNALADRDIPHKIVMLAKADHVIWKKRLADMMVGAERLNADELSSEKSCRLGLWYYGPGSLAYRNHPAFAELESPHRAVHQSGIEAVRLFNNGRHDDALQQVAAVERASLRVISCLDALMSGDNIMAAAADGTF